ncbi:MAG TPA: PAS domain-containing protein, partial [Clostridia bacterium]|nr:PAS domain-containing protein [Clostridia bacterium]
MTMDFLSRLAVALAKQFGDNCEVVVHDLTKPENTIVAIENGHVSNRKLGDGPSHIVLEAMKKK